MIRELTWTRLKHNELSASSKVAVHWNDQKKKKKNQLRKDKTLSIWSSLKDEMQQGEKLWEKLSFQISEDLLLFNTELCSTGNFTPQDCQTHSLGSKCSGLESKFHSGTKRRSGDCFYFFRAQKYKENVSDWEKLLWNSEVFQRLTTEYNVRRKRWPKPAFLRVLKAFEITLEKIFTTFTNNCMLRSV